MIEFRTINTSSRCKLQIYTWNLSATTPSHLKTSRCFPYPHQFFSSHILYDYTLVVTKQIHNFSQSNIDIDTISHPTISIWQQALYLENIYNSRRNLHSWFFYVYTLFTKLVQIHAPSNTYLISDFMIPKNSIISNSGQYKLFHFISPLFSMFSLLSECDKPILNFSNRNFVSKLPIYAMPTLSRFWNPSFTWPFYSFISMFLFLVYLTINHPFHLSTIPAITLLSIHPSVLYFHIL